MNRIPILLGAILVVPALSNVASAQFDPHLFCSGKTNTEVPLPYLDVRLDPEGRATLETRAAIEGVKTAYSRAARVLAVTELARRIPDLRIDDHDVLGTPHFVRSTLTFLTQPVAGGSDAAVDVVRDFLEVNRGLFEVAPGELMTARLTRDFRTEHNGLRHLTWKQEIEGVELFQCEIRANVTALGELVNVSSTMLPRPTDGFHPSPMRVSDERALRLAAASAGFELAGALEALGAPVGPTRSRTWSGASELRSDEAVTTALVYFPRTRTDIRSAWAVVVPVPGVGSTYDTIVDATTGEILRRDDRLKFAYGGTQPISFRVFPFDSPAPGTPGTPVPNGFQYPTVTQNLVTVNPGDVAAWSPDHWINDGVNETNGNNVDGHLDLDANNSPDLPRPTGVPFRTFDFIADTTLAPTNAAYRSAAVTQIFYLSNRYHDKMYSYGFDEAAKNFQQTNFTGFGTGGDPIQADGQDGGGTNNANFGTTGTDGSTGRMQMYVFTGPTPDRDGDLDADIVYHELSHGLSIRLLDGQASGTQAGGMGEGWGDFLGLCLNAEPTDDPNAVYAMGGWTVYQLAGGYVDNYYFGIRRFPYSTDLNKNPQTYADIDTAQQSYPPAIPRSTVIGNTANEVHNVGEVWCVTLWDVRANLIAAHGFVGNDEIMNLVVDGLKLCPGTPNFLQSRDSILQADLVNTGGANLDLLWQGFAKRGQGFSATSPGGSTSSGIVEAFDLPNTILFAYPAGHPSQLAPANPTSFQVEVTGLGTAVPTPASGTVSYSVNDGGYTTVSMTETTPNHYTATLPGLSCFDLVRYYVSVGSTIGVRTDPSTAPAVTFNATVMTGNATTFQDNFQTDLGWTPTNLGATSGDWQRGTPVNDATWAYDPTADGDGSGQCWLTQNAAGNTDVDGGAVQLLSPVIDFSSLLATISYEYYLYNTSTGTEDSLLVEINSNGGVGAWTQIAIHQLSGGTDWRHNEVSAVTVQGLGVTLSANTRVRFTASDAGTQNIVEAGLDGFRVSRLTCTAPSVAFCFGDGTGAACPCGNNGAAGQGCANSFGSGATLVAAGAASVSADTFVLSGSGMPNASALYFQGTAQGGGGLGLALGDGLRCATGAVIRLGTKTNAAGASSYPQGGDLSVSVRGLIPAAGGVRTYQVWYRNAAAFCTSDTFNLSNGLEVTWAP